MKKYIVFIIIVIAVIVASGWLYIQETNVSQIVPPTTTNVVLPSGFGHNFEVLGLTITPTKVLQDSRCPIDVQCIQAGTVELEASVATSTVSSVATFTLGKPTTIGIYTVTLTTVTPDKKSKVTIAPADYSFTFSVTKQ